MLKIGEIIKCIKRHDRFINGLSYEIDDIVPFDEENNLIMIKSYTTLSSVYVFSHKNIKIMKLLKIILFPKNIY